MLQMNLSAGNLFYNPLNKIYLINRKVGNLP